MSDVIRIANCSGFYGDRLSAAREMVEGGPIDVLTGDYLAELTMSILHRQRQRNESAGYARTFLRQLREVITLCAERDIKIVTNAGGLNPGGLAREVEALASDLACSPRIAWIDGDDLIPRLDELDRAGEVFENLETGETLLDSGYTPLTANTYLGCWGIKRALDEGANIVICPRVTDAALVMGPAAWRFGWSRDDYDALAGALAAGHIIECGTQATGGNYSFFEEVPGFSDIGFPIAEIEADGSATITKHEGTGGLVSRGTVISQLLYEILGPAYLSPDVIAHFDTLTLEEKGENRVRVTGCLGSSPPTTHKVCITAEGGFRSGVEILLTGLDIEEKAKVVSDTLFTLVGGREQFDDVAEELIRSDRREPQSNEEATASLRISVNSTNPDLVGRNFVNRLNDVALANIPGFAVRGGVGVNGPFVIHWPALVDSRHITERVHLDDQVHEELPTSLLDLDRVHAAQPVPDTRASPDGETSQVAFGRLFGTRSGDKGGNANLGVWARSEGSYGFLFEFLTVERLKQLLPDMALFDIERYELPNIWGLNFVIHGVLGRGVSGSARMDGQAKSLGEYLRVKEIEFPCQILPQDGGSSI